MARRERTLLLAALVVLLAALAVWWWSRPDGRLHLLFPAVRGDALLVVTPGGSSLLVDGGADPAALPQLLGRQLPAWQRRIDALVLTSADSQRLPGLLAIARRYSVGTALLPAPPRSKQEQALVHLLQQQGAEVRLAQPGDRLELDGVRLLVTTASDGRLALRLEYRSFACLLAPTARQGDLATLASTPAHILFYPWHGPDDRTLAERIGAAAVVYGENPPPEGHPQRRSYFERGSGQRRLLHEQIDGSIEILSDGVRVWVETEEPDRF